MNQFVKIFVYLKGSTNSAYFHSKKSETWHWLKDEVEG